MQSSRARVGGSERRGILALALLSGALTHCADDGAPDVGGHAGTSTAGASGGLAGGASTPAGAAGSAGAQGGGAGGTSGQGGAAGSEPAGAGQGGGGAGGGAGQLAGGVSGSSGYGQGGTGGGQPVIDCQQVQAVSPGGAGPTECVDSSSSCVATSDCASKGFCGPVAQDDDLTRFHGTAGCVEGKCHYLATRDGSCTQYAPCAECEEGPVCLGAALNHCTAPGGKTCTTSYVTCSYGPGGSHAETCVDGKVVITGCKNAVCDPQQGCP